MAHKIVRVRRRRPKVGRPRVTLLSALFNAFGKGGVIRTRHASGGNGSHFTGVRTGTLAEWFRPPGWISPRTRTFRRRRS